MSVIQMKRRLTILTGFLIAFLLLPMVVGWQADGEEIDITAGWHNNVDDEL